MIISGDCIEQMKLLPENSVDAIVTDPPYNLSSIVKRFGKEGSAPAQFGKDGSFSRLSKGFMGKEWDNEIAFGTEVWIEALRVLKPGGFLLSFGGTRTYHRLACGIEDAGFEIRDTIMWLYGSGFPKSLNIGKQIDKIQGNEREVVGTSKNEKDFRDVGKKVKEIEGIDKLSFGLIENAERKELEITKGNSEWEGWGTGLKPACEPIVVARKSLSEKNVALNVLKWGTGGINIDACRIGTEDKLGGGANTKGTVAQHEGYRRPWMDNPQKIKEHIEKTKKNVIHAENLGRFPANIILDEEAGKMLDEQSGKSKSQKRMMGSAKNGNDEGRYNWNDGKRNNFQSKRGHNDKGGASRFFYCAKASKGERNFGCENFEPKLRANANKIMGDAGKFKTGSGNLRNSLLKNNHPTVKPIKLMEYLVKLITRENSIILDPFLGSGTTAIACLKLGRRYIGIEKEEEYIKIANARIKGWEEKLKEKNKQQIL